MRLINVITCLLLCTPFQAGADQTGPAPYTMGHYRVLSAAPGSAPPFEVVNITCGPRERIDNETHFNWQLEVKAGRDDAVPLFQLRCRTEGHPLNIAEGKGVTFHRYVLHIPETGETIQYDDAHADDQPLLPFWDRFTENFIPQVVPNVNQSRGMPHTLTYMGHVLTLHNTRTDAPWDEWKDIKVLRLDSELLIGTSRSFRDRDGKRLPQHPERQDYPYVQFMGDDYRQMIETGVTLFTIRPEQEQYVRSEPVFYHRGAKGNPPLRFPADLYRSNYLGATMFMDEPGIIMIGDEHVHSTLQHFTDASALLTKRVRARYLDDGPYGAYNLERQLESRGVNFGDMRLAQLDYPSWETRYETAYYQLAGGVTGIVHEGRYHLAEFNEHVRASTGLDYTYTPEELILYHIAHLRGAARHFGKAWGISIYGQADPEISPLAVRLAYDKGARYIWYWTSDHEHHLPFPEQMELTRMIHEHERAEPRRSIRKHTPTVDKLILIPWGYFLVPESPTTRKGHGDLWWVRELDPEKKNEASQRYRRLMRNVFTAINTCFKNNEEFDICVDDGRPISGYKEIIRVDDQ